LAPKVEAVFEEQGFIVLHWADLGWMRFFVPEPDPSPDALRSYTYVQWGDNSMADLWREAGFQPGVELNMADILMGLERGTVTAINTAPLVVGGYMWFEYLPYMINIPWAPLSGATLIDKRVWESIPEDLRPELMEIAKESGERVQERLLEWEANTIRQMEEQAGLTVINPEPSVLAEWDALFQQAWGMLRGSHIPEEWFAEAVRVVREGGSR
jgi:TRAP-type C4-dicarboxylate transport system substrate-binding protein